MGPAKPAVGTGKTGKTGKPAKAAKPANRQKRLSRTLPVLPLFARNKSDILGYSRKTLAVGYDSLHTHLNNEGP